MNQAFGVNNTTKDITHSGPVAQKLALHKGATLIADTSSAFEVRTPISIATLKQAAMGSTIIIDVLDPAGTTVQIYTINKVTGAPDGSVARALIDQLNLKRVGDCALLHFFMCQRLTGGEIVIFSDDNNVFFFDAVLFNFEVFGKEGGEAIFEIRALNVTPGEERVSFFSSIKNAFV